MRKIALPVLVFWVAASAALPSTDRGGRIIQKYLPVLERLAGEDTLIQEIQARNGSPLPPLEEEKIEREWVEIGISDLERPYLHNPACDEIRQYEPKIPPMFKCFVLDCRGNVVGTVPQSHNFSHGKMEKFLKCYNRGKVYVGPEGLDISTKIYSVQVSVPVIQEGKTIGVLIASLSLE